MKLSVLGGGGAWPTPENPCGGYLLSHDDHHLLIDPGYATFPRLLTILPAHRLNAVLVTHGHPDHCADLNPLLRARVLDSPAAPRLKVFAPPGALDAVLRLDRPGMLDEGYTLHEISPGCSFATGPFQTDTMDLPHHVVNLGVRICAAGRRLAFTGDSGPTPRLRDLAGGVDLYLAEATYAWRVPAADRGTLSTARQAGADAAAAGVGHLVLTHLWPGTAAAESITAARREFSGRLSVAAPGQHYTV